MLDALLDAMLVIGADGTIALANEAACRLLDVRPADLAGSSAADLFESGPWQEQIQSAIERGVAPEAAVVARGREGRGIPLTFSATSLRDSTGETAGVVAVLRRSNLARRSLAPAERLPSMPVANLEQSQKLQAVGLLAGGVAHEYNNMMTIILNFCDLLLSRSDLHAHARSDIVRIERAAQRVASLTGQLLAFARKQVLRPELLDFNQVARETSDLVARAFGRSVQISLELGDELGCVRADPGQLEQVLTNLLVNARDAMPRGGQIKVSTANLILHERLEHRSGFVPPGEYVLVTVEDQGEGMDELVQKRAFEPFFSTKDVGKGTGLGLSSSYGIVKQTGGYMWIDKSAPGAGTTFKICLPRARASGSSRPPAPELERTPVAAKVGTILLVDDESGIRESVSRALRQAGHSVLVARDAAEALWAARRHNGPVDVLLTDVNMPNIDGFELQKELVSYRPGLKTVFMSGSPVELGEGQQMLSKPLEMKSLIRVIDGVLGVPAQQPCSMSA